MTVSAPVAADGEAAPEARPDRPSWWPPDPELVRVVTFNAAVGNPQITTRQEDFVRLPFYRAALEGTPDAPLLALQEVGPEQARALRQEAERGSARVLQVRRPGQGNALVIPARYELLGHRRRYFVAGQLRGLADSLRRWQRERRRPDWRQLGELRMWIQARLRDRASGRELAIFTTHLSGDGTLKLAQAREIVGRAVAAAGRDPVILAGDLNIPSAACARGLDAVAAALLRPLGDMGTAVPPRRPNIDYVLALGFEPVASRIWTGDSLHLPGSPDAERVSDHYAEDDVLRYVTAAR